MPTKQDELKKQAALAAIKYIKNMEIIGIGTGSTVNHFIDQLSNVRHEFDGAVSSSIESTKRLRALGIPVYELNDIGSLDIYIDGADEINRLHELIKGGGGALTREKIIAANSKTFICIADQSKYVRRLGKFPLPIEVIPMASSYIARELVKLGGHPEWREGFITDNGNIILDVHRLEINEPIKLENTINNLAGVVTVGLFANRPADIVILASEQGIETLTLDD